MAYISVVNMQTNTINIAINDVYSALSVVPRPTVRPSVCPVTPIFFAIEKPQKLKI